MADLTGPAVAISGPLITTGVTLFGVATGLDPGLLIAGAWGGIWAQEGLPPRSLGQRLTSMAIASLVAGYFAPPLAAAIVIKIDAIRELFTAADVALPIAMTLGLIANRVLGPALLRLAGKKAEDFAP